MATFRGISAIGTAVLNLFTEAWARDPMDSSTLETKLVRSDDLASRPTEFGVSLYVFRVGINGTQRTLPPAVPGHRRPLPVEVHFVITPWALSAQRELELLGWCMRVLDDQPVLDAAALNAVVAGVFGPSELVEIVPAGIGGEEYFRLWDTLAFDYQLSVGYTARLVRIESLRSQPDAGPVLEREMRHGELVRP